MVIYVPSVVYSLVCFVKICKPDVTLNCISSTTKCNFIKYHNQLSGTREMNVCSKIFASSRYVASTVAGLE